MRRPRGPGWDPLVIQIYIPTREYIPTIHSAHVTIQMLLALHSKINIFTQNKGINNLWGKNHFKFKALGILLSSCHFIAHYCQWSSSPSPSPGPSRHVFLRKHLELPAWPWMPHDVFYEGKGTAARRHLEAHPTLRLGPGNSTPAPTLPCWDIHHTL